MATRFRWPTIAAVVALALPTWAVADIVTMNFDNVSGPVGGFYNSGTEDFNVTFGTPAGDNSFAYTDTLDDDFPLPLPSGQNMLVAACPDPNGCPGPIDIEFSSSDGFVGLSLYYFSIPNAGTINVSVFGTGANQTTASLSCTPTGGACAWEFANIPLGFTANRVVISGTPDTFAIDSISIDRGDGTPNPAPEPASVALVVLGLLGAAATRRRRR